MTFVPTDAQIAAALAHAGQCQPLEACGVILADGAFVAVANLADERGHFVMDRAAFCRLDADRSVVAIVHSHVDYAPTAGEADRAACEASGLPWLIVSWPAGLWCVIQPGGFKAPLVGRSWQWGSHDCYGLIRDALRAYAGIELPDHDRNWLFWRRGRDDIGDRIAGSGFVILPPGTAPQQCDLFAMMINSPIVNHLALFLEPDLILHQLYRRLSVREIYGGAWREATALHLRHERLSCRNG